MTFNVVLPGVVLANVGYKWLTAAGFGSELTSGVTDTGAFYVFLIDAVPPAGALELFAYDVTDPSTFARGNYPILSIAGNTDIAAIRAKTDNLTFTVPNQVDANTQSINDTEITGDGQPGTEFGV
jgi:hypothetical protein